ncbi:GNAT family N-acetyltransferase [Bacillus sp. BHET2]|uniref:GNAT family N-acetyltransferase n=1 Tax=Bacillus sp. BHET2 TaxID=2583818 RepID=UPI00110D4C15|nr:GNAT family N-acetyltransferase [Bacillus sp. BHET2]TMU86918.1 GNAT family N-acetyltransferase [Bacillus sp. BHET2]
MLTTKQLQDIKDLQTLCETQDGINLKLNWDMLENRQNMKDDFLQYVGNQLIGFIGLYGFGDTYELCGMIHPAFRRQHLFHGLFQEAIESLRDRTVRKFLLNTPGSSSSGKAFLSQTEATYDFTEYEMKWNKDRLITESQKIQLRVASEKDIETIIDLDEKCFQVVRTDAESYTKRLFKEAGEGNLMIVFEEKTIGKIRIQRVDNQSFIYGFAIHPSYQGKGIGRKVLSQVVMQESMWTSDIYLDVAATNRKALKLYESSGFQTFYSQDYYLYPM